MTDFDETLRAHGLQLTRDRTAALQVNVGLICDLSCRHCHLQAGPGRGEMMDRNTMDEIIACARRLRFSSIDITGGSPEMVPGIDYLVSSLAALTPRLIVRSNLSALSRDTARGLLDLYRELKVVLVASLPATNASQTEAQRGAGVWEMSIAALKRLNLLGYGVEGGELELDLVSNPSGAFLPPAQGQAEKRFRSELLRRYGITFNSLYSFANVPLGRFRFFLEQSGNLEGYLAKLRDGFNPCSVGNLMCRSQVSVDWCGRLYDCDFHLAAGIPHGGARSVGELKELPAVGTPIPTADYCYACTAGSGFT